MLGSAAFVLNSRGDILAANRLGQVLMSPVYEMSPPNMTRFVFLDPGATTFFRDWHKVATDTVAILRAEAGRDPFNKNLTDLVGELSTRSDEFRVRWAAHDVQVHTSGTKLLHHPVVGDLDIQFESMPLPGDTDQSLLIYTAEPSSPSQDALALLASWAATPAALPGDSATEDSTETASKHSSET
ncbi:unannotated protein [freshwater metagenome]|uniref:Unannotated protein n=1 Tax=freshwater metagenome TaxID=449393 RepID=A0A6J6Q9T3_9ZZZZ